MRIGVLTVTYRDERFMETCIKQFYGLVAKHLVLVSDDPWRGKSEPLDKSIEIAERNGAEVIVGNWETEAEQRNFGVSQLQDMEWIFIVDTDERYERKSAIDLIHFLETQRFPAFGIGRLLTYWKDTETIIDPEESGGLIVAIKPTVSFTDKRCIDSQWGFLPPHIVMHHLSYVRTDEEMKRKISTFEHSHEIVPNWYQDKWLTGTENLHPVNPESFKGLKKIEEVVRI